MNVSPLIGANTTPVAGREKIGTIGWVSGSHAVINLQASRYIQSSPRLAKIGQLLGVLASDSVVIGTISEIGDRPASAPADCDGFARLELVGEITMSPAGRPVFCRGVSEYPSRGDSALVLSEQELQLIYRGSDRYGADIGEVHQDGRLKAYVDIDELVSKHFAILGTTGVGKSSGVAIILREIIATRPNLRVFLVDPHNEYGRCFGDKAQIVTPSNLRLPFWLFNFEEIVDVFFGGRPGVDDEVEILANLIPQAKAGYLLYGTTNDRQIMKRKDPRNSGFTADTPVPYRIDDLIGLIDEQMGKLENRASHSTYSRLMSRIQTLRNNPRYGFIFENANIGGDIMGDILSALFRLPADGKPMTIMQLAGFPAEVVDAVVSVLCRMAFDFGLWSDGAAPLLFMCEEAHRYAPAQRTLGFGPTRRALSRIAKEGRKYGVYLGLVTQRAAEIDPTIISQCNTLFVMRMSNDRDQALVRSAVSDAAASLLSFLPSLGTREVFACGSGIALPTRLRFKELPADLRPCSEAAGTISGELGGGFNRDVIASVVERWRNSTMSQKSSYAETAPDRSAAIPEQVMTQPATPTAASPLGLDPARFRTLKKPIAPSPHDAPSLGQPLLRR
jgi:DNA helicase HerA-like ATPase